MYIATKIVDRLSLLILSIVKNRLGEFKNENLTFFKASILITFSLFCGKLIYSETNCKQDRLK